MDEGFLHIFLRYAQEISRVRASVIIDKVFESIYNYFFWLLLFETVFFFAYSIKHMNQKSLCSIIKFRAKQKIYKFHYLLMRL